MKVLVIGSGGREHALAWKIKQSKKVKEIFAAPGNGGTQDIAANLDIDVEDIRGLADFAENNKIDLTIAGPEIPLVNGVADEFKRRNLKIFGPVQQAALLEGSKVFAKEIMARSQVPTAAFRVFSEYSQAEAYLKTARAPVVVKADGLAAGKGVVVCASINQAMAAVKAMMQDKIFGPAADKIIIEDCLRGEEASILVLCDGKNVVPLASSQDHKRIYDGDKGPNTGGMGAYSPAPCVTPQLEKHIDEQILRPLFAGFSKQGIQYQGVLYLGLMLTKSGPQVLEFNARFGDPETQVILPRLKNDLIEVMLAVIEGRLSEITLNWDNRACICVVLSSGGYPGKYEKGKVICGLKTINSPDVIVFHAATKKQNKDYLTTGGRVLNVVALGNDLAQAKDRVYRAIEKISFEKMYFRRDIGWRALEK